MPQLDSQPSPIFCKRMIEIFDDANLFSMTIDHHQANDEVVAIRTRATHVCSVFRHSPSLRSLPLDSFHVQHPRQNCKPVTTHTSTNPNTRAALPIRFSFDFIVSFDYMPCLFKRYRFICILAPRQIRVQPTDRRDRMLHEELHTVTTTKVNERNVALRTNQNFSRRHHATHSATL